MSDKTVRQLAEIVKIPLERLLEQLKEAGLSATTPDDFINEDEKMQLLAHLRKRHGKADGEASNSPRRVTLERRKVTEIKQASVPGSSTKTISVEVRKKKTYIKREDQEQKQKIEEVVKPLTNTPTEESNLSLESSTDVVAENNKEPVEQVIPEIVAPIVEDKVAAVKSGPQTESQSEVVAEVKVEAEAEAVDDRRVLDLESDLDLDTVDAVVSEAKFEALKVKEEKKIKQEKSIKTKEAEDARKKQQEKESRLEESIRKNADKVRQQAAVKQETLHRKKQDETSPRPSGKEARKGKKKGKQNQRNHVKSDGKHQFEMPVAPIVHEVTIPEMIIVSDLAQKMSVKAALVIKHLMKLGIMATITKASIKKQR